MLKALIVAASATALTLLAGAASAAQPNGVYTNSGLRGPSATAPAPRSSDTAVAYRWVRPNGSHDTFLNRLLVHPTAKPASETATGAAPSRPQAALTGNGA